METTTVSPALATSLLGEVVTWDVHNSGIDYEKMLEALDSAGLDKKSAHELTPKSAFSRACKDLKKDRAIDKLKISKAGMASFQFTAKKKAGDGKIDYDYECLVEIDCDSGSISCPENPQLEGQAKELVAFAMQTRTAQDITRLVQGLFERHADLYPINPRKGVAYFVPECHREFTTRIERFLKELGGVLHRFPVPKGTAAGNASVKDAVQSGLSALLAELNQAVQTWDDTTRSSTMEKAAERYSQIKYKVEAYTEYLGAEQDRLKIEVEKAQAELRKKVAELKPADEAQPAAAAA